MRARFGEIASRHRFVGPLLAGARVLELGAVSAAGPRSARSLQDRGAASVISSDRDPGALSAAAEEGGGPGLHFRSIAWAECKDASLDLVLVHDPSWILEEPGLPGLRRILAPGGQLLLALRGGGPALGQLLGEEEPAPPLYGRVSALLAEIFASVEVVVQRAIVGHALSPLAGAGTTLAVEELSTESEEAGHILFLCGERPSGLIQQKLVLSRLQPLIAQGREERALVGEQADAESAAWEQERSVAVELATKQAAEQFAAKEAAWEQERTDSVELATKQAAEQLAAKETAWELERDALRALAAAQAPRRDESEADEELMRRVREAQERAEAARLHAKEAEARMRAAERRADAAEAERARSALTARRYQAEVEQLRRAAEGVANALAHTPSGSAGRPV